MKKLKSILGSLAPTLGAAIGGPLGGQAGQILSQVLGVPNNQNSIEQAMNNITAEQMIELKKAETDFEVRMRELDVDVFRLETEDVKDAREKFSNDWTPKVLGLVSMFGFMALQQQDFTGAIERWQKMLILVTPNSDKAKTLNNSIAYAKQQLALKSNPELNNASEQTTTNEVSAPNCRSNAKLMNL